jgi:capsular polysaccharide biosynthesis protein
MSQRLVDDVRGRLGDARRVAVLYRPKHEAVVDRLATVLAGVELHRLDARLPHRELHVRLAARGPVDAVVDLAVKGADGRREVLGLHVPPSGVYLVREPSPDGPVTVAHRQPIDAVPIVREADVPLVLELDPTRGRHLETRPGASWRSTAGVRTSGPMPLNPLPATYEAPPMLLREWSDVVALPRQTVLSRSMLLPESFSTADGHRQVNPTLDKLSPRFAHRPVLPPDLATLEGAYFHLENVMPGHFGHALTEQVSRLWGWPEARAARPGTKALLFAPGGHLPAWQTDLLAAGGVPPDQVHVATGPVRVETLVSTTPMFSRPAYIHPGIRTTYDRIGAALEARATRRSWPAKVFFTRRPGKRSCHNAAEVEATFAAAGYEVVYPEDHPLADQVAMVRAAGAVGGFGGSGMFHIGFAGGPKHVVLVTSETYPCHNEYLMSALLGHRLDIVVCRPDVPRGEGAFTRESFHSDFVFDPVREGPFLADVLAE